MANNIDSLPLFFKNLPAHFMSDKVITGQDNIVSETAENVIVNGQHNYVGEYCKNVNILNSSGCIVEPYTSGVIMLNSSGITTGESGVFYQNNKKTGAYGTVKYYTGKISQSGVSAPGIVETINSMTSPVTTSYSSVGIYYILCDDFIYGSTATIIETTYNSGDIFRIACISDGVVQVESLNGGYSDSILNANFEIKV